MAILLTTHYLDEAEQLCDRIAIMHEGRIVALDTPEGLLGGLGDEVAELRVAGDAGDALARLRASGLAGEDAFSVGSTVTVPLHDWSRGEAHAAVAASDVPALSLITRPPTLDDVYLRLTGSELADAA
jgi:ABC-2 type transport system ATP-binding protein